MPITSGQFTTDDMYFSLAYKMGNLLAPATASKDRIVKVKYEGLELHDWVLWAYLYDNGRTITAAAYKGYCKVIYAAEEAVDGLVPDVVRRARDHIRNQAASAMAWGMKKAVGAGVREPQIENYDFDKSIDPTHTMIAKDATDSPLHRLAAKMAEIAVLDVGRCIADAWEGKRTADEVVACASKYFVHPAYSSLLDSEVNKWADANKAEVQKASSIKAIKQRLKHHDHGHGHGGGYHGPANGRERKAPKISKPVYTAWNFATEHYVALTGQEDLLPDLPDGGAQHA